MQKNVKEIAGQTGCASVNNSYRGEGVFKFSSSKHEQCIAAYMNAQRRANNDNNY